MWIRSTRYLVNLKPLMGIGFRRETQAGSAREALNNVLYYYFGKDRSRLSLYLWQQQQEYGQDGWDKRVDEAVNESIGEEPVDAILDDLEIVGFQKTVDKQHPGAQIAATWKDQHHFQFILFDKLIQTLQTAHNVPISVKLDGELVCLYFEKNASVVVTAKGTIRSGFPVTQEVTKLLQNKKHNRVICLGELYVVDKMGKPVSYMTASSILKKDSGMNDDKIRLSVFDLISIDNQEYTSSSIEDRLKAIQGLFQGGKYVHAAHTEIGGPETAESMWDNLEDMGWEGLVVHVGNTIYKSKPIISLDMQVIAVNKSKKFEDQISAILVAFLDKDGRYRLNGMVGGGLSDTERAQFMQWAEANKISEDEERIWVDPTKNPLIVEIEVMEINTKKMPALRFKDRKWISVEEQMCGSLRFPQFERVRDDKTNKYEDIRVEQLPNIQSSEFRPGRTIKNVFGHMGRIKSLITKSSEWDIDFDLLVEWYTPVCNRITESNCHPSEVVAIWD